MKRDAYELMQRVCEHLAKRMEENNWSDSNDYDAWNIATATRDMFFWRDQMARNRKRLQRDKQRVDDLVLSKWAKYERAAHKVAC